LNPKSNGKNQTKTKRKQPKKEIFLVFFSFGLAAFFGPFVFVVYFIRRMGFEFFFCFVFLSFVVVFAIHSPGALRVIYVCVAYVYLYTCV